MAAAPNHHAPPPAPRLGSRPPHPPHDPAPPAPPGGGGRRPGGGRADGHAGDERTDGELVAGAAEGDAESWNLLVKRFAGLIWAISRSCGLSAAEAADVNQVVWLRLLENL